jgi:hypothetical protein
MRGPNSDAGIYTLVLCMYFVRGGIQRHWGPCFISLFIKFEANMESKFFKDPEIYLLGSSSRHGQDLDFSKKHVSAHFLDFSWFSAQFTWLHFSFFPINV